MSRTMEALERARLRLERLASLDEKGESVAVAHYAVDATALRALKEVLQELDWGYEDEWVVAYEFVGGLERLHRLLSDEEPPADG